MGRDKLARSASITTPSDSGALEEGGELEAPLSAQLLPHRSLAVLMPGFRALDVMLRVLW